MAKKILIIEDDAILRKPLSYILQDAGYDVFEAASGEAGIDMALSEKPDLILLDLLLPQKSGWEVLDEFKKHKDKDIRDIPVLVLSVVSKEEQVHKKYHIGKDDYIIKSDYSLDAILKKVQKKLR